MYSNIKFKIAIIFFCIVNLYAFGIVDFIFSFKRMPIFWFMSRAIILVICLVFFLYLSNEIRKKTRNKSRSNILALIIVFVSIFYILEIFFTFYPKTNGLGTSYSARLWMYYYWNNNQHSFRDIDFNTQLQNNKKNIYILGDSFTAGHGIKLPKDRFSDILRQHLPQYNFYNLGRNGYNTIDEYNLLINLPKQPQMVIWTYMYNDIDCLKNELKNFSYNRNKYLYAGMHLKIHSLFLSFLASHMQLLLEKISGYITYLMVKKEFNLDISYEQTKSLNYKDRIDVITKSSGLPRDSVEILMRGSLDIDNQLYMNNNIFNMQMQNMKIIKDYCDKHNIKLMVLIYPRLDDNSLMSDCKNNCKKMEDYLISNDFDCINLTPICASLPKKKRVVNNLDSHPSVTLNKLVADTLINTINLRYSNLDSN